MKKKIILISISLILLNSFSSLGAIEFDDYGVIGCTLSNQPILSCFFLLSSVPVEIVSLLMNENVMTADTVKRPVSKRQGKSRKNSSAVFSLCDINTRLNIKNVAVPWYTGWPALFGVWDCRVDAGMQPQSPPGESVCIPLILLILLIMLPRSGIRGSSIILRTRNVLAQLE